MPSPFIKGIVPLIIFFFFVVSLAYGIATGKIRRQADLPQLMIEPMKEMAGFIVMVFPLAQFVAMFNWSNMGKFMAVGLTDLLESAGMNGVPAFVGLALLSAFCACLSPAARQSGRFWRQFSCRCLCCWAFTRHLRRFCSVSPIHRCCRWRRYRRLCRCFSASYSATGPRLNWEPTTRWSCLYPLIFPAVWLLLLVGWYLVGCLSGRVFIHDYHNVATGRGRP